MGPAEAARFNRIRDAYEILSDPVKTLLYDTGGMEYVQKFERGQQELERTDNIDLTVSVSLEDIYIGTVREIAFQRRTVCRSCRLEPRLPRCRRCSACPSEIEHRQVWVNSWQYMMQEVEVPSPEKCVQEKKQLAVQIERGMLTGDRIHHEFMASQLPKRISGDVLVAVQVQRHDFFKRVGSDLIIRVKVSLYEALLGFERELVHLDGHI